MNVTEIIYDVLNNTEVRDVLRNSTSGIEKLESLDSLRNLRLISLKTESLIQLSYEAIATSDLYPHVRTRLIDAEVIKKHNVRDTRTGNKGQPNEYESVHLTFHGADVQVFLKVYNPNYHSN